MDCVVVPTLAAPNQTGATATTKRTVEEGVDDVGVARRQKVCNALLVDDGVVDSGIGTIRVLLNGEWVCGAEAEKSEVGWEGSFVRVSEAASDVRRQSICREEPGASQGPSAGRPLQGEVRVCVRVG